MASDKRIDRRVECVLDVQYEFVKWDDDYSGIAENKYSTKSIDLSISGICLSFGKELNHHLVQQLLSGTRKIRLGIFLPGRPEALVLFAHVVWSSVGNDFQVNRERCGCVFIDPPELMVYYLKRFVEEQETPGN